MFDEMTLRNLSKFAIRKEYYENPFHVTLFLL